MSYNYKKKLEQLKVFHKSMIKLGVGLGTFEHSFNGVNSDVIFDTKNSEWKLVFIKHITGDILEIYIRNGYLFAIEGNEEYKKLITYFGISGKRGEFHIGEFTQHLNKQIPDEYVLSDRKRKVMFTYFRPDEECTGIYPIGLKNWEKIHAENPSLPKEKYHRSKKNLEMTKEYYPEIYKATKDYDITIIYASKPGNNTTDIVNVKITGI